MTDKYRNLKPEEIIRLERQGCRSGDWSRVMITDRTDLGVPLNVTFESDIRIGALEADKGAMLEEVKLVNVTLGDNVAIERTSLIEFEPGAPPE